MNGGEIEVNEKLKKRIKEIPLQKQKNKQMLLGGNAGQRKISFMPKALRMAFLSPVNCTLQISNVTKKLRVCFGTLLHMGTSMECGV